MNREDFDQLPDPTTISLENQLLITEVQILRGRLGAVDEEIARAMALATSHGAELERLREQQRQLREQSVVIPRERYEQLRSAQRDLRWLLKRLESSPLGFLLSRRAGFKTLVERHLS